MSIHERELGAARTTESGLLDMRAFTGLGRSVASPALLLREHGAGRDRVPVALDHLVTGAAVRDHLNEVAGRAMALLDKLHGGESQRRRVVLVDDDEDMIDWTRYNLGKIFGGAFETQAFIDPAKALDSARAGGADDAALIISDFNMPGMDGLAFMQSIREIPGMMRVPGILFSDNREFLNGRHPDAVRLATSRKSGEVHGFLKKTAGVDEMAAEIESAVGAVLFSLERQGD